MDSLLRIRNVSESVIYEVVDQFNSLHPDFCDDIGKHQNEENLYSFFLSTQSEWLINHDEMVDTLTKLLPALLHAQKKGALFGIDICICSFDYPERYSLELFFSTPFFKICDELNIVIGMSIFSDMLSKYDLKADYE